MSKKSNIYLFNSLKSVEVEFNKPESLIISRLMDMNNRLGSNNRDSLNILSRELLNIFNQGSINMWSQVDRICVSLRDSASNQIYIASVDQNENVLENILRSGYSCVVDESSSLMSLKDGEIRTYDNIENIITSFSHSGRKVQRSIGLIEHSKIKSGLTIPLTRDGKTFGFLFLNSTKINTFKNLTGQDYSILCMTKLIVQNIASETSTRLIDTSMFEIIENVQNKNQIIFKDLKKDLERVCREYFKRNISFKLETNFTQTFLLPHRKYINAICTILKNIENFDSVSNVHVGMNLIEGNELKSEITFHNTDHKFSFPKNSNENSVLDLKISRAGGNISFFMTYEPMVDNLLYSVI